MHTHIVPIDSGELRHVDGHVVTLAGQGSADGRQAQTRHHDLAEDVHAGRLGLNEADSHSSLLRSARRSALWQRCRGARIFSFLSEHRFYTPRMTPGRLELLPRSETEPAVVHSADFMMPA